MRGVSLLAVAGAALLLAASGSPRGIREGGTFKVAIASALTPTSIDPALGADPYVGRPTCGTLMAYPDVPPPEGLRLAPDLADSDPVVSKDGKTYAFTVRKDARFSDGSAVTNWSYFNSPAYNRLLDRASRLTGAARNQAYAALDIEISRDAAPAIPYAFQNGVTFVSARTGCLVRNPIIDLTSVCLK